MKAGTRIEIQGWDMAHNEVWEAARIARRTKDMGAPMEGWHPVRFDVDGATLMCHESRFRVVDNRQ